MQGALVRVWVSKANSSDTLQSKELLGLFSGLWRRERWRPVPHSRVKLEGPDLSLRKLTGSQH